MIGYLEGKLRHKSPDYIIIDAGGVGYMVHVPLSTFYDLPDPGETVSLHIHTHVREDLIQLFGFRTHEEKQMFLHLVAVNGVGPKLAINILSRLTPDQLRTSLLQQDHRRFQNIPGIGKKTAERIILELRDKVKVKGDKQQPEITHLSMETDTYADAFSALVNLGYRPPEAERALNSAQQRLGEDPTLQALLKEALRFLSSAL